MFFSTELIKDQKHHLKVIVDDVNKLRDSNTTTKKIYNSCK